MFGHSAAQFFLCHQVKQYGQLGQHPPCVLSPNWWTWNPWLPSVSPEMVPETTTSPFPCIRRKVWDVWESKCLEQQVELYLYHSQQCGKNVELGVHTPVSKSQAHHCLAGNFRQAAYLLSASVPNPGRWWPYPVLTLPTSSPVARHQDWPQERHLAEWQAVSTSMVDLQAL